MHLIKIFLKKIKKKKEKERKIKQTAHKITLKNKHTPPTATTKKQWSISENNYNLFLRHMVANKRQFEMH